MNFKLFFALGASSLIATSILAQEQLLNGDFETMPPGAAISLGNNTQNNLGWTIPNWTDNAQEINLVRVDGTTSYGLNGPRNDADALTNGFNGPPQHYFDMHLFDPNLNGATGSIRQVFTPTCWTANVSAAFSSRLGVGAATAPLPTVDIFDSSSALLQSFSVVVPSEANASSQDAQWQVGGMQVNFPVAGPHVISVTMPEQINVDEVSVLCVQPQITYSKTPTAPGPFQPGDTVSFVVHTNVSNAPVPPGTTLLLNDPGANGLTLTGVSGAGWNCASPPTGTCALQAPTTGIAAGALPPVTFTYSVDAPQQSGTLTNCAVLSEQNLGAAQTQITTSTACADIKIVNPVPMNHYAVKFVCGFNLGDGPDETKTIVGIGAYSTEINILNPGLKESELEKFVIPLVMQGEKAVREPEHTGAEGYEGFTLPAVSGTMDDCLKIGEMLKTRDLVLDPISIGYLSIYSPEPLDVTAVYTQYGIPGKSEGVSIDVEMIEGRIVDQLR